MKLSRQAQISLSAKETSVVRTGSEGLRNERPLRRARDAFSSKNEHSLATRVRAYTIGLFNKSREWGNDIADVPYLAALDGQFSVRGGDTVRAEGADVELTDEQASFLASDNTTRVVQRAAEESACPQCGVTLDGPIRLCLPCMTATALEETDEEALEPNRPLAGIVIEFCEASGAGPGLALAKENEGFQRILRGGKTWYQASWPGSRSPEAQRLANLLSGVRNRRCYLHGQERPWEEMFGCARCVRQRESAYRPDEYCFGKEEGRLNPWRCKQAQMDWSEGADWFSHGSFSRTHARLGAGHYEWTFDKKRIRAEIDAKLSRFRNCPHLDLAFIDAVLEALPDRIRVEQSSDWRYSRTQERKPGSIEVHEKINTGAFVDKYFADGVRPVGFHVFVRIVSEALKASGRTDIEAYRLTRNLFKR